MIRPTSHRIQQKHAYLTNCFFGTLMRQVRNDKQQAASEITKMYVCHILKFLRNLHKDFRTAKHLAQLVCRHHCYYYCE